MPLKLKSTYFFGGGLFALATFFTTLFFLLAPALGAGETAFPSGEVEVRPGEAACLMGDVAGEAAFLVGDTAPCVGELNSRGCDVEEIFLSGEVG